MGQVIWYTFNFIIYLVYNVLLYNNNIIIANHYSCSLNTASYSPLVIEFIIYIYYSEKMLVLILLLTLIVLTISEVQLSDETIYEIMVKHSNIKDIQDEVAFCNNFLESIVSMPKYDTLASTPRLKTTIYLSKAALKLQGSFVETGVYRGGTTAIMMKLLMQFDKSRKLHAFDSFEGLPKPDSMDGDNSFGIKGVQGSINASLDEFISNLKTWNAWDDNIIQISKGYFNETLPASTVKQIAFLRLDGDLFISTHDALVNLYAKLVPGGYIYIDDYGSFTGCRKAVDIFRTKNHIFEKIHYVRENHNFNQITFEGIWWRKRSEDMWFNIYM